MAERHILETSSAAPNGIDAVSPASEVARDVKALVLSGRRDEARERFGELVALLQRRAVRLAFHYLRDPADADEAVQDAFVKVFVHIERYRDELPFDSWFTRILVNTCLDRLKGRARQQRCLGQAGDMEGGEREMDYAKDTAPSAEQQLLARERWQAVSAAVATLPDRQRLVFTLSHVGEQSAAEIGQATGMSPATVRVHLFRAIRKLRAMLGDRA